MESYLSFAPARIDQSSGQEGILKVINFFEKVRFLLRVPVHGVATASPVPDIPLVERQPQLFWRSLVTANHIANRQRFLDLPIHREIQGEKFCAVAPGIFGRICEVSMEGQTVDVLVTLLQYFAIPFQISWQPRSTRSAGHELEGGIDVTHLSRRIRGSHSVFSGLDMPNLPGAIHLIAEAPVLHMVRIGGAVLASQIAPTSAFL